MWSLKPTSRLQPDHLRYLSRGINTHGALEVPVPERLYRPLIVLFSEAIASNKDAIPQVYPHNDNDGDGDDDSDREETTIPLTPLDTKVNNIIRDCYKLADDMIPGSPTVKVPKPISSKSSLIAHKMRSDNS